MASVLVQEDGPFNMFSRFRDRITPEDGELHGLSELFSCLWCTSLWVAAGLYPLARWGGDIGDVLLLVLAASTVAIVTQRIVRP